MIYFAIAFGIIVFISAPEFFIALCLLAGLVWLVVHLWFLFGALFLLIVVVFICVIIGKKFVDISIKSDLNKAIKDHNIIKEIKDEERKR